MYQPLNAGHTGTQTCVVLCSIPGGMWLESGYTALPYFGGPIRLPEYRRVQLQGSGAHVIAAAVENGGKTPVARKFMKAGITVNVDEAFFDQWCKDHFDSNLVKNSLIRKAKNFSDAMAQATDETERKTGWEALDQAPPVSEADANFGNGFDGPNRTAIGKATSQGR
jgi:hypothetical protein